jgi:DNA invertase Pin-like site-specific DNA recombinase
MIRDHCAAVGLPEPKILGKPLGTSGRSTDFRHRPQGRWLLLHAEPGDVVVVTKLDRLGRTARDILDTLEQFAKRGVRVIVIQFLGGQNIDMDSTVGRLVVIFFAGLAQFEADMIGERTSESLQWRRQQGLACNHAGFGTRKVGKRSEWDMQQLAYIAEIAERLGKGEDVMLVVADLDRVERRASDLPAFVRVATSVCGTTVPMPTSSPRICVYSGVGSVERPALSPGFASSPPDRHQSYTQRRPIGH